MNYKEYYDLIKPTYITWEFYSKYIDYNIPFGAIGDIVDCRTYRRFIPELNRRERAIEAFLRVVEYNIKLVNHLQPFDVLQEEAELMFDSLVNLKMLPSNRSRWTGGTKSVELNPSSIFNCSFCAVNRLEVFGEIFELLCLGVGVGYRVFYRDINALPNITNRKFHLVHKGYTPLPKQLREEHTTYYERDGVLRVTIGDSRQGWKDALMLIINVSLHDKYKNITSIEFDYDSVRPFGERILGFGGTASGHEALKSILVDVFDIITKCPDDRLRTLDCLDIPCAIARGVVAGSSRRSALMVWFEEDDELCANSKVNIPPDKTYRYQANITSCVGSLYYDEFLDFLINTKPSELEVVAYINSVKPPFEYFQRRFKQMESLGEPGINNFLWLVYKRWLAVVAHRPDEVNVFKYLGVATNPCLSGDTIVVTKQGHYYIKDLVDKTVEIFDGDNWVTVNNFRVTANNEKVYAVELDNGQVIKATLYHEFVLEDGTKKQLKDIQEGDKLKYHNLEVSGTHIERGAYLKGFAIGDGTKSNIPLLNVYFTKYCCKDRLASSLEEIPIVRHGDGCKLDIEFVGSELNVKRQRLSGLTCRDDGELIKYFGEYKQKLPIVDVLNWSLGSKCEFIAGLFDADGTASDNAGGFKYQISSIYKQCLLDLQLLLESIGVKSKIGILRKEGLCDFNDGYGEYKTKTCYRLTISQVGAIKLAQQVKFERLVSFADRTIIYKKSINSYTVKSINFDSVANEVYCCNIDTTHTFALSNNVLTGNCSEIIGTIGLDGKSGSYCNLSVNNLLSFVKLDANNKYYFDYQDCKKTTELITRIGLRQTEVVIPMVGWNETQREERLLGVDTTCGFQDVCTSLGWSYDSPESSELRIKLRKWANAEATKYAAELNVPRPLLVTTSKPNGATAQVLGTASGIHWNWNKYYLRRVTATSTDPLALTLLQQGFKCYPGVYEVDKVDEYIHQLPFVHRIKYKLIQRWNKLNTYHRLEVFNLLLPSIQRRIIDKCNTIVFEFPVKTNTNVSANDVSALDQLESQRLFSVENTDHMPSITITVKKNEWNSVTKWVYDNWTNGFNTAAFLSYDGKTYPLLPFQTITEKEYKRHLEPIKRNAVSNWNNNGIHFKLNTDLLDYYEALLQAQRDDNDLIVEACEIGGSCPSR